jgi:plasmid stability protein
MKTSQYTIRGINPKIDSALRSRARRTGRSINTVTLEALQAGLGLAADELLDETTRLPGLAAFDNVEKKPSPFDSRKSIKELYRESIAKKYDR